jgi:HK97 family phage prohead protease
MFDQGTGAQGAHYMADNPFAAEGLACSNCAFYDGPRACEIVAGDIDPEAVCKFWIIPETLLTGEAQGPATEPMGEPMTDTPVRYAVLGAEQRRINGRDVEFRTVEVGPLELRTDGEGDGMTFRGYAAVFNSPSEPLPFVESIAPGAFRRSLNSGREVRAFVNHDTGQVLATTRNDTLRLIEDSRGLLVEADLPDTTAGRDLAELVRTGTVHSMSFGFSVPRGGDAWSEDRTSRELREVILHEVSVVTGFPAYPATEGATVRTVENDVDETPAEAPIGPPVALRRRILELNAKR